MHECNLRAYSNILKRNMEYSVYGDSGKTCFVFPEQDGRFYDFKNFGMIDVIRPWIDCGKVKIICVDGIDKETWSNDSENPRERIELHERWFHYIVDELLPIYSKNDEKAMVTGCSMGGMHAANFFFRRPDLFDTLLSLSGLYNARYFFKDYFDSLVYDNSPVSFLPNMQDNHPWINLYRKSRIIACVGQGLWEDDLLFGTRELDTILAQKNIPHCFDYWGYDVSHDWYWWQKQMAYFFEKIFGTV